MSRKPLSARNTVDNPPPVKKRRSRTPFPIVSVSSLVNQLNLVLGDSLRGLLTEQDIRNPSGERVQDIFLSIVTVCFDTHVDMFRQVSFEQASQIEHAEHLETCIYRIQFFRAVKMLMKTCMVNDFTSNDLFFPDPGRLQEHLSGFVNYVKFHHMSMDEQTEAKERVASLEKEHAVKAEECSKLKEVLANLERKKREEEKLEEEVRARIEAQKQAIYEKLHEEKALKDRYKDECDNKFQQDHKNKDLEERLEKLNMRLSDLFNEVVSSPEKIRSTLEKLQRNTLEANASLREMEEQLKKWETLASQVHQISEGGILELLKEDIEAVIHKVEEKSKRGTKFDTMKQAIKREEQLLQEATQKMQTLTDHMKLIEEDLERGEYKQKSRVTDLQRDFLLLQQELHQWEKKEETFRIKCDKEEIRMSEWREGVKRSKADKTEMAALLMERCHHIMKMYKEHMGALGISLE